MQELNLNKYLKKSFLTGSVKTIVVAISTIVLLPLIIQRIGMETYGLISLTMIFGGMVVFADFGVSKAVTLLIGKDEDKKNVNSIVSNALVINFSLLSIIGLALLGIVFLDVPILGEKFAITNALKNHIILIGFVLLTLMLINNLLTAILESFYLMHFVNIGFGISSILLNLSIFVFSLFTESVFVLLLAPLASFIIVTAYFTWLVKTKTPVRLSKPKLKQIKKLLSISYRFLNISLVSSFIIPINKYLLLYVTGSSAVLGVFDIGLKIAMIANSFLNSIAQPLFGVFSNLKNKTFEIYKIAKKTSLILFGLYLLGIAVFYLVGEFLVHYIDEEHEIELFMVGLVLLVGVAFTSVSEPFYRALLGTERLKEALYLQMLLPIFNVCIYFLIDTDTILMNFVIAYSLAVFVASLAIIIYYSKTFKEVE